MIQSIAHDKKKSIPLQMTSYFIFLMFILWRDFFSLIILNAWVFLLFNQKRKKKKETLQFLFSLSLPVKIWLFLVQCKDIISNPFLLFKKT